MADVDSPQGREGDDAGWPKYVREFRDIVAYEAHLGEHSPLDELIFKGMLMRGAYRQLLRDLPEKGEGKYHWLGNEWEGL